jgi:mRNA interferase MazF
VKGAVYSLKPPKDRAGHEQDGERYGIVMQATRFEHLSTWLIVPTSASPNARRSVLHPVVDFGRGECVALVEALRAVDPEKRLGDEVGFISLASMQEIDRALAFVLDLGWGT